MITIKDFQKGDKVYILIRNTGRNIEPTIYEIEIKSVGRTYVTVENDLAWSYKFANCDSEFLREKAEYGESKLLFKTKKCAEEYVEKCKLAIWIGLITVREAETYSLEQLRKVKEIMQG